MSVIKYEVYVKQIRNPQWLVSLTNNFPIFVPAETGGVPRGGGPLRRGGQGTPRRAHGPPPALRRGEAHRRTG